LMTDATGDEHPVCPPHIPIKYLILNIFIIR
jgi:hypothetical protein